MSDRHKLLKEISDRLEIDPPFATAKEMRSRLKIPRSVRTLDEVLAWVKQGCPKPAKKYKRKALLSDAEIIELWKQAPHHGRFAAIARKAGVSPKRISQIIEAWKKRESKN